MKEKSCRMGPWGGGRSRELVEDVLVAHSEAGRHPQPVMF